MMSSTGNYVIIPVSLGGIGRELRKEMERLGIKPTEAFTRVLAETFARVLCNALTGTGVLAGISCDAIIVISLT